MRKNELLASAAEALENMEMFRETYLLLVPKIGKTEALRFVKFLKEVHDEDPDAFDSTFGAISRKPTTPVSTENELLNAAKEALRTLLDHEIYSVSTYALEKAIKRADRGSK